MSLWGRLDDASAKVRGVPPSTVDARMIEPRKPGGKGNVSVLRT
jgi:hypothetical protein